MTYTEERVLIREFTAARQVSFFAEFKQNYFSGQIEIRDSQGREYTFFMYLGRIIYATGGVHQVRRWKRYINQYCPNIATDNETLAAILSKFKSTENPSLSWEYLLLALWLKQEKISREQLLRIIHYIICEIIFDLSQIGEITYLAKSETLVVNPAVIIDANQVIAGAWKMWLSWQSAKLRECSPNAVPILKKPEQLKSQLSPGNYQTMVKYTSGDYSLRDIATRLNHDLIAVTKGLMVYVQLGVIELEELPDLPTPESDFLTSISSNTNKLLIGCVDDSQMVCKTLESIFKKAGHDFVAVSDGLKAFSTFIECKPDLIFLDLIMPTINGYQLCENLRRISVFQKTPIIMLTQNSNILDRLRGKLSGFNDFLSKPINSDDVLRVVHQYNNA
jgi:chemotaxis family two-component system response regulator PixG